MRVLAAAARFLATSVAAYAACAAWPALALQPAAWVSGTILRLAGITGLGPPVLAGATVVYARTGAPIVLEDPYILAGIPLYLGLWAVAARPPRALPWGRLVAGGLGFEILAGLVLALVAVCVDRGYTASPPREPLELVALASVAAVRVLPLPLWMMLDPARAALFVPAALAPGPRSR